MAQIQRPCANSAEAGRKNSQKGIAKLANKQKGNFAK